MCGEDKSTLSNIKNILVSSGNIYIGGIKETCNVLRIIRRSPPQLIIIEVMNNFKELKPLLEVIDEETLAACILVLDQRNDEVVEFLRNSKVISYVVKPVIDESVVQIVDLSLMNYSRILNYEQKLKKLNETLESRKALEQAKWILAEQQGISEAEAYEAIRKKSRNSRMTMRKTAEAIILTRGII